MKIAVIGAHSTGKTTLLVKLKNSLGSRGLSIQVIPEMSRLCPFPINEETTLEAQKWILKNQIEQENKMHEPDSFLLCDRAAIDNMAYFLRVGKNQNIDVTEWEILAVRHMATYDFVFKTQKLSLAAKADGQRALDENFRKEIDDLINSLLIKHQIPHFVLPPTTDYETHVNFIFDRLGLPQRQGNFFSLPAFNLSATI